MTLRRPVAGRLVLSLTALSVAVCALVADAAPARAQSDAERELAERHVPVIMLKEQEDECDPSGEQYAPMSVDHVLDNPEVLLRQVSIGNPVVMRAPGAADLFGLGEGFFLDFAGDSLHPGCVYERDFRRATEGEPAVVYARVITTDGETPMVFVRYWFYWYYNDWNNRHESDWEGITVVFEADSVEAALAAEPIAVGYSQHEGGERADWDDGKLERDGDRPVVYSSAGSHASYFGSAVYLGRGASEGFGCDDTTGPSIRLDPEVVVLPERVDDPDDPLAWLAYEGRWGERQQGPFNGPTGPAMKDHWSDPEPWFDELRATSVVIPAGDTRAGEVISAFCGVAESGSRTLVRVTQSPVLLLTGLLALVLVVRFAVRRTDWSVVATAPLVARRRAGQILRAAARIVARHPVAFAMYGLVAFPTAAMVGLIGGLFRVLPVIGPLASLAGDNEGANLGLVVLAGGLPSSAAFTAVSAIVVHRIRSDHAGGPTAAVRAAWEQRRALIGAFARVWAIVTVLFITTIGIPFAIWSIVRYQFIAHAVTAEGLSGGAALRRSASLVRGRWWHTAVVVALVNAVVGGLALLIGLLLLVVFTGLPLWLFAGLVSFVYAAGTPLVATAVALLYGDACAAELADVDAVDDDLTTVDATAD